MKISKINKDDYPIQLKQISQLPPSMSIVGELPPSDYKYLCVVGARQYSTYGKEVCDYIIRGLSNHKIVIVSGLAIGIDSLAHEAAIKYGLKTIAFPGSGLDPDVIYPQSKRKLSEKIIENGGALISPFEDTSKSALWTFPVRNRLMAGISHATLIIEARDGSGTLLTANHALAFGREVCVVPGSIFKDLSLGARSLMKDGARPIYSADDVLEALGFEMSKELPEQTKLNLDELSLTENERKVLEVLKESNSNISEITKKVGAHAHELNIIISELELRNLVTEAEGIYRIKV